jgi:hypothetical protein
MSYHLMALNSRLIFITWERSPTHNEAQAFLHNLERWLNHATQPLYFISDLRQGRIVDIRVINQLGQLTKHPNWGGSTAFSQSPLSKIFVGSFQKMAHSAKETNSFFDMPEQAINFLEVIAPGVTQDIDWHAILGLDAHV